MRISIVNVSNLNFLVVSANVWYILSKSKDIYGVYFTNLDNTASICSVPWCNFLLMIDQTVIPLLGDREKPAEYETGAH